MSVFPAFSFPFKDLDDADFNLQSQSLWLGHFGVSLSPQCWCTRFGDRTAINNFERDGGAREGKKQRLVKVSQRFLSETVSGRNLKVC